MTKQFMNGKRLAGGLLAGTALAICLAIGAEHAVGRGLGGGVHGGGFHGGGFHGSSFAGGGLRFW